ncbi:MAG: extracellular solute-binding protein [Promicromonosporaceae bacterium]|nr:extracellular solute-binding protein [Promicromonosporaceae bacterium]
MNKKAYLAGAAAALVVTLAAGCASSGSASPGGSSDSKVTLSFTSNIVGAQADALGVAVKNFTAQTGIKVDYSAPGAPYEDLMKTKMASNDMPDLFTTHGWSVMRYSPFLASVNDQPFFAKVTSQIKPVITDESGKAYVLPVDEDVAGIVYNVDVLKKANIDPATLTTWAKFTDALGKIKAAGVTPLHVGGKDTWPIGQFGDWIAPSFFVTNDADNQRDALKKGTFDKGAWEKVAGLMSSWVKAGYFNADAMTADYNADAASIAQGTSAFGFYGNSFVVDAHKTNPNANLGVMPIPAATDSDTPSMAAGEKLAIGVWKDSPHKDAAFKLLNYLAQDDNVKTLAEASGSQAGLDGVKPDLGSLQPFLDKNANVRTFPYFDRAYLPSGMWDVMCSTGADILSKKPNAVAQAGTTMEQSFKDKFQAS